MQTSLQDVPEPTLSDPVDLGWGLAPEPARSRRAAPPARVEPPRRPSSEEIDDGWFLPDDAPEPALAAQPVPAPQPEPEPVAQPEAARLDLNAATADELCTVPGIARTRAARILALRDRIGRFESVDDLARVQGLGAKTVETLRPYLTV